MYYIYNKEIILSKVLFSTTDNVKVQQKKNLLFAVVVLGKIKKKFASVC